MLFFFSWCTSFPPNHRDTKNVISIETTNHNIGALILFSCLSLFLFILNHLMIFLKHFVISEVGWKKNSYLYSYMVPEGISEPSTPSKEVIICVLFTDGYYGTTRSQASKKRKYMQWCSCFKSVASMQIQNVISTLKSGETSAAIIPKRIKY